MSNKTSNMNKTEYKRMKYDRFEVLLPKGRLGEIREMFPKVSVNSIINKLISDMLFGENEQEEKQTESSNPSVTIPYISQLIVSIWNVDFMGYKVIAMTLIENKKFYS